MIRFLERDEIEGLGPLYEAEWEADTPNPRDAVIANIEDGELKAFITAEAFVRFGMLWLSPRLRNTLKGVKQIRALFRYLWDNAPKDAAYIIIADDPRFESAAKHYGFRPVEGKIYRLDR